MEATLAAYYSGQMLSGCQQALGTLLRCEVMLHAGAGGKRQASSEGGVSQMLRNIIQRLHAADAGHDEPDLRKLIRDLMEALQDIDRRLTALEQRPGSRR
jgi:hypothetical protein